MVDFGAFFTSYNKAVARLFEGDLSAFGDLLADDIQFNGAQIGKIVGRAAVLEGLQKQLDAGWAAHNSLSFSFVGNVSTATYRNDYRNGQSIHAAGVLELNSAGKVQSVWTFIASVD